MRKDLGFFLAALVIIVAASYVPQALGALKVLDERTGLATTKACLYPIGGWTKIDCSNSAAATSAQLVAFTRYVIQCGDDSYIATGDDATDSAATTDGWLPQGAWLEFMTSDTVRYISCRNKNVDSDCRIWECQ